MQIRPDAPRSSAPPTSGSRHTWLVAVFLSSLAIRLPVLWSWQRGPLADCLGTDPQAFLSSALAIAAGGWTEPHGLMLGGPLYPYFLGVLAKLLGPSLPALRLAQAVAGALGGTLVAALGARLFSRAVGLAAAAGTLLYGPLLANELGFENEFLAVPLVAGALLLLEGARSSWRAAGGAGVLLGLAALLRGNQLMVSGLALAWLLFTVRPWQTAARRAAALGAGVALALSPIAVRNLASVGEPLPLGAHGGYVFHLGHHEGASWRYVPAGFGDTSVEGEAGAAVAEARRRSGRALSPGEASAYWYGQGLRFVASHPGRALRTAQQKLFAFFQDGELPDNYDVRFLREEVPPLRPLRLSFGVIAPLAAIGLLGLRERRQLLVLLAPAAAIVTVVGFYYNARFRLPAVPFLILLAAEGARLSLSWLRARDPRGLRRAAVAAGAGSLLVALAPGFRDDFYFPWILMAGCSAETKPERAEALYRRALDLHPREPEARLGLASLLSARGDATAARQVLVPLPENAAALVLLASIDAEEGRLPDAVAWLEAALAREPALASAWNDLGVLHARSGRPQEALFAFGRALALDPDQLEALGNVGRVALEAGDAAAALRHFELALAREDGKELRLLAAVAALRGGLQERGRHHLAHARRLGATPAEIQETMAR